MARYILLSDFEWSTRRMKAGDVFADEWGDPVGGMMRAGVPLVPATDELVALGKMLATSGMPATQVLLASIGGRPIQPDSGGVVNVYVDGTNGNDENDGGASTPFKTWSRAIDRWYEWLRLGLHMDFAVRVANGDYDEDVKIRPSVIQKRRLVLMGDPDKMAVLTSGTLTGGGNTTAVDSGASWGTSYQYAGKLCRLRNAAGVLQYVFTIKVHNATTLYTSYPFNLIGSNPAAGWTYEILDQQVSIRSLQVRVFFDTLYNNSTYSEEGPCIVPAFLKLNPNKEAVEGLFQEGGECDPIGCEINGSNSGFKNAIKMAGGLLNINGLYAITADPVFGLEAGDYSTYSCAGVAIYDGYGSIRLDGARATIGLLTARHEAAGIFAVTGGSLWFAGGALIGEGSGGAAGVQLQDGCEGVVGGYSGIGAPVLLCKIGATEIGVKMNGVGRIETQELELRELGSHAFAALDHGAIALTGAITETTGGSDVAGDGVRVYRGGSCRVQTGVSFAVSGVGEELRADSVPGTFAALVVGTPVLGADTANIFRT